MPQQWYNERLVPLLCGLSLIRIDVTELFWHLFVKDNLKNQEFTNDLISKSIRKFNDLMHNMNLIGSVRSLNKMIVTKISSFRVIIWRLIICL